MFSSLLSIGALMRRLFVLRTISMVFQSSLLTVLEPSPLMKGEKPTQSQSQSDDPPVHVDSSATAAASQLLGRYLHMHGLGSTLHSLTFGLVFEMHGRIYRII